ncbi:hypothetical protein CDD83_4165 [Cordyceps sp. RAO-2017]|nr:hypothetical protein CDD83_4165 [Cordyceps sp. RAO-2017]
MSDEQGQGAAEELAAGRRDEARQQQLQAETEDRPQPWQPAQQQPQQQQQAEPDDKPPPQQPPSSPRQQPQEAKDGDATSPGRRWSFTLPSWLDHFNLRDFKIVFRCWVAIWVGTILIFIQPALHRIGLATFFGALLLYIVPPASILAIYLFASFLMIMGMCVAWLWGLIVMKAALSVRPSSETHAKLQDLQQMAAARAQQTGQTAEWEATILIHDGFMLDARITAITYAMCLVFIYALARLRCYNPKLTLFQIMGSIIIDLFLLIGPTLPSWDGSLASVLVKPGAVGVGLGLACCVLFFPQSTSYAVLEKMEKLVRLADASLDSARKHLAGQKAGVDRLRAGKAASVGLYKTLQPILQFLPLDVSRGRWNAEDVEGLAVPVRDVMLAHLSLVDFQVASVEAAQKEESIRRRSDTPINGGDGAAVAEKDGGTGHDIGRRQLLENAKLIEAFTNPEMGAMRERAMQGLQGTTAELLDACSAGVKLAAQYIHTVNTCRWIGEPSQERFAELARQLEETRARIEGARARCVVDTTEVVLQSHGELFGPDGQIKVDDSVEPPMLHGVVTAMVIEERILDAAVSIEGLLEFMLQLGKTRTAHRIWLPNRLRYALHWLTNGGLSVPISVSPSKTAENPDSVTGRDVANPAAQADDQADEAWRQLRVVRGKPGRAARRGRAYRVIAGTWRWLTCPDSMYAIRITVATFATSIPAAIPHSAGFFYREKGIWAVVTVQTSLLEYMADFTLSLFARAVGTVVGGVMGMVAWYMGSGGGPGNPYGMGASTAFWTLILVWLRLFLPPAYTMAAILCGVTFMLVIGFSYDDQHIMQYGFPGIGYASFYKRVVLLLLGFVALVVVQMFPRPPSSTAHVRKTLANVLRSLADHYALLVSHWARPGLPGGGGEGLGSVADQISIEVAETLLGLQGPIALLKIELGGLGPFDQRLLAATQRHCGYMNQALVRLLDLSSALPKEMRDRLVVTAGFVDDRIIGDVMAVLAVVEQALRTGSPLPERLPVPLLSRYYEMWRAQQTQPMLSRELLHDQNYRRYCVALSSYLKFLSTIDDLVLVLKEALGENHIVSPWDVEA